MGIININENFGDQVYYETLEEMKKELRDLGYMPADGLKEGVDYELCSKNTKQYYVGNQKATKEYHDLRKSYCARIKKYTNLSARQVTNLFDSNTSINHLCEMVNIPAPRQEVKNQVDLIFKYALKMGHCLPYTVKIQRRGESKI